MITDPPMITTLEDIETYEKGIESFEAKTRTEVQKGRLDKAIKTVEESLTSRTAPTFTKRFIKEIEDLDPAELDALSEESGLPYGTLLAWANFSPKAFKDLASVCKALDVSADYLLGLIEERKSLVSAKADSIFNKE